MVTEAENNARTAALRERVLRIGRQASLNEQYIESRLGDDDDTGPQHAPILRLRVPATLVATAEPDCAHLYLDRALSWPQYVALLSACANAGLISINELETSLVRQNTIVPIPDVGGATSDPLAAPTGDDIELVRQLTAQLELVTERLQAYDSVEGQLAAVNEVLEMTRGQVKLYRDRYNALLAATEELKTRLHDYEATNAASLSW